MFFAGIKDTRLSWRRLSLAIEKRRPSTRPMNSMALSLDQSGKGWQNTVILVLRYDFLLSIQYPMNLDSKGEVNISNNN